MRKFTLFLVSISFSACLFQGCSLDEIAPATLADFDILNGPDHILGETIIFDNTSKYTDGARFTWDFGDGNVRDSVFNTNSVSHSYDATGTYTIRLTAHKPLAEEEAPYSTTKDTTITVTAACLNGGTYENDSCICLDRFYGQNCEIEGNLMTDFEESDPNIVIRNFEFEFTANTGVTDVIPAGQGETSLFLEGTDAVVDNFFVGLVEVIASITGKQFIPMPSTIPEEVYFNALIYGTGDPYTIAIFDFYADNGDGIYNANNDQQFTTGNIDVTWSGWQQYSIQMSELGISEQQLSQIVGIRAVLISDNSSQPTPRLQVSYATDYWIFTKDQALMP